MRTFAAFLLLLMGGAAAAGIAGSGSVSEMGAANAKIIRRAIRQEHNGSKEIERVGTERVLIDSRGHTTSAQQKHIAATNKNDRTEDIPEDKHGRPIFKGHDGREYTPVSSRTCDSQNIAHDQKKLFPILDLSSCRIAARFMDHTGRVEEIQETDRPEGCFSESASVGSKLRFNTKKGGKAKDGRSIVCTTAPYDKHGRPIFMGKDGREYTPVFSRTCDSQSIARDQKKLFPILDPDVCRTAAGAMPYTDTDMEEIEETDRPEGCFSERASDGMRLRFNTKKGGKAKDGRSIVCTATPPSGYTTPRHFSEKNGYFLVVSGTCDRGNSARDAKQLFPILDQDGCRTVAEAFKVPDTEVEEVEETDLPEGCFASTKEKKLVFNTEKGGESTYGHIIFCTATPPTTSAQQKHTQHTTTSTKKSKLAGEPQKALAVPSAGFIGYLVGCPVLLMLCGACGSSS